ncbi:Gfo/Idh/MocA family protein [Paucilactobacillus nenjiangensis]|uniref:Gfo/Idh/MocA family protein n=1 Tax=Paucilactobacillus nenjiangensis TaxID=1296540 RepID=UPI003FA3350D
MLKLGIIGTNWITDQFIDGIKADGRWELASVYSRTMEKATAYQQKHGFAEAFADIDQFFEEGSFDTVYIASPNSMHYQYARQAIENDKHVIVEKPSFANIDEFAQIEGLLQAHPGVRLLEAARHVHTPLFKAVQAKMAEMTRIQGATLTYMKYSSRYDKVLAGERPNVFTLDFAGGALYDLGVYPVYAAVALFGEPESVVYFPTLIETGADGKGVAVLGYENFEVTLNFGKTANSHMPSEIYGLKDTIVLDNVADFSNASYFDDDQVEHPLATETAANPMKYEIETFTEILQDPTNETQVKNYQKWFLMSKHVNGLLFTLRESAGLDFPSDDQ